MMVDAAGCPLTQFHSSPDVCAGYFNGDVLRGRIMEGFEEKKKHQVKLCEELCLKEAGENFTCG